MPLALVIAASRLAYEPGWQIAQFQQRLAQVEQRLPALRYEVQNVRLSFQLSYELLDAPAQQLFAAIGLLGRQDFSVAAAAALVARARRGPLPSARGHRRRRWSDQGLQ